MASFFVVLLKNSKDKRIKEESLKDVCEISLLS